MCVFSINDGDKPKMRILQSLGILCRNKGLEQANSHESVAVLPKDFTEDENRGMDA